MSLLVEINSFGKWLKTKREANGLSMRTLTERAGNVCSPSYIAQLETNYYVGKKGSPMQPSEEIVEKLAIALGASVNEARKAANYPFRDEALEISNLLPKYNRLSSISRQFVNQQFKETIDFLLSIEGIEAEDAVTEAVVQTKDFEDLISLRDKPAMLSDEEINRLGIKPIKVGKIKKEAR